MDCKSGCCLCHNQGYMGNNDNDFRMEREQRGGSRLAVYPALINMHLPYLKRTVEMAQIKWALFIADLLGIPAFIMGIALNFGTVKAGVLFIVGLSYVLVRLYFYVAKKKLEIRKDEIDLWFKEQEKRDRINQTKK